VKAYAEEGLERGTPNTKDYNIYKGWPRYQGIKNKCKILSQGKNAALKFFSAWYKGL
jgi:hypothetical protein